jgi:hypothetical protein
MAKRPTVAKLKLGAERGAALRTVEALFVEAQAVGHAHHSAGNSLRARCAPVHTCACHSVSHCGQSLRLCVCVHAIACVRVSECVRACVRVSACVRACVRRASAPRREQLGEMLLAVRPALVLLVRVDKHTSTRGALEARRVPLRVNSADHIPFEHFATSLT